MTDQTMNIGLMIVSAAATVALLMVAPRTGRTLYQARQAMLDAKALVARADELLDDVRPARELVQVLQAEADRTGESVTEVAERLLRATR